MADPKVNDTQDNEVKSTTMESTDNEANARARDSSFEDIYQYIIETIFQFLRVERLYYKFAGEVTSAGAGSTPFYKKLSVSKTATGTYKFIHNFHTSSYTVVATPKATAGKMICLDSKNDNDFTLKIYNASGTAEDNAFEFAILLY